MKQTNKISMVAEVMMGSQEVVACNLRNMLGA